MSAGSKAVIVTLAPGSTAEDYISAKNALEKAEIDFVMLCPHQAYTELSSAGKFSNEYSIDRMEITLASKDEVYKCLKSAGFKNIEIT